MLIRSDFALGGSIWHTHFVRFFSMERCCRLSYRRWKMRLLMMHTGFWGFSFGLLYAMHLMGVFTLGVLMYYKIPCGTEMPSSLERPANDIVQLLSVEYSLGGLLDRNK